MLCTGVFCFGPCLPGATLASLASNEQTAGFIMHAPGDSVAKAMLALLEVEDEPGFSNPGGLKQLYTLGCCACCDIYWAGGSTRMQQYRCPDMFDDNQDGIAYTLILAACASQDSSMCHLSLEASVCSAAALQVMFVLQPALAWHS